MVDTIQNQTSTNPTGVGTRPDWEFAKGFLRRHPTRWGSLNWIAARPLIASINQLFSERSGYIVNELRDYYTARSPNPSLIIDAPDITTFMVIGDTGEADASQYVVAPALSRAVRDSRAGFVVIMSDVIYPSGDVNDYVDGLYRPYRSRDDDQFSVYAPLLGQPGNHDWYGSLSGFMYNFCYQDKPPGELYAGIGKGPVQRLMRILWRRPSSPSKAVAAARTETPAVGPAMSQPGPYYAIKTRNVLVVNIDTGISGNIDPNQMRWLENLSRIHPGPKLLVTGSPLLVNAEIKECVVEPETPGLTPSVWQLVNDPANNYVATVGGDVHNFQRYTARQPTPGVPQVHIVSGGGGAFMHALHPMDLAVNDSRVDLNKPHPYPDLTFPTTHESFSFFGRQLIPSIWRILRALAIFLLGTLTVTAAAKLAGSASLVDVLGFGATGAFVLLLILRMTLRRVSRSSMLKRALVPIGAYVVGIVAASVGFSLDPDRYLAYVILWLLLTAWHTAFGWGISRSGWWLPLDDYPAEREVSGVWFFLGLGLACLVGFALQLLFFRSFAQLLVAGVGVLALFTIGLIGWYVRRRPGAAAGWRAHGTQLAVGAQVLIFGAVVSELAIEEGLLGSYGGGLLGIGIFVAILLITAVLLVGVTELVALPARIGGKNGRRVWSGAAKVMRQLLLPLIWAQIVVWGLLADSDVTRAAAGFPIAMTALVSVVIFTDLIRRYLPTAYKPIALAVVLAGAAAAFVFDGWAVQVGLAAALIVMAVLFSVTLAHLVFLGAHLIIFDAAAHQGRIEFTPEELTEIFAAKTQRPRPGVPKNVARRKWRWATLTYPGIGEPGGPLQLGVAEIYSTDEPPFYKEFLQIDTTADRMRITMHKVFGEQSGERLVVADVRLR